MSTPREQDLKELTEAYALGALGAEEARAFEAWLATSAEAQREVAEYREVGALLALSAVPGAAPSADLKDRVLARVAREKVVPIEPRPAPRGNWPAWLALAASLVAVSVLSLTQFNLRKNLAARDSVIASLEQDLAASNTKLAERQATLYAIFEPGVTLTRLTSPSAPEPGIQLFWNRRTNVAIAHAVNLKPTADKRVYQLWFIPKNGKPIPSVTFNSEPTGHALVQQIPVPTDQGELAVVAITEEPEGGSPQPTTTPFMIGTL